MATPVTLSSLSSDRVFFRSEGSVFVMDGKDKRMFLIVGDKLAEITAEHLLFIVLA